ncbi:MAG: carboxypeptidase regulatory-like domain-containing protein [Pyrinomonadaceae bacterium]|nr:carboxypeptidase regulatory-like domain-containing protein [Pyrinomonadaceae bacterium]MBP6211860.1 carboxypeptidase regulatory-like domain-containing protein [Pyrinomonadaceae bacterium]
MRSKLFLIFLWILVYSFSLTAQTVVEAESRVTIEGNSARVRIIVNADRDLSNISATVELLDIASVVRSRSSTSILSIKRGKQSIELDLPLGEILRSSVEDIAWYRLRYTIGNTSGIISMSQLIGDLFELRIIASENLLAGMTYRVRVRAVNQFTEQPAQNVQIETAVDLELSDGEDSKLRLSGTGETDDNGFAVVDFTIPTEAKLDGDGEIRVVGRKNGVIREATEDVNTLKDDLQFLSMTDKPIYQPEQMLNVRGILLKGGEAKTVLPNSEVEFRIVDQDDTVLYRQKVRSSEYGIASISWMIPANAKLGEYMIEIRGDDEERIGGQRIKVSRYDLPNFAVAAKVAKPYYLPGENEAEVEIKADYLFGKPVTIGTVRIVQENSREWDWKEQKYIVDEGQIHNGRTDEAGKFNAKVDLKEEHEDLKDDEWRRFKDVHFAVYFTDLSTNRTEQRRFDVRVTKEAIHVYYVGETYNLNSSLPIDAYVSAFYADGTPAECDVEVKASPEDENKFRRVGRLRTNSYGAGKLTMTRPSIGDDDDDLDFSLTATDGSGRKGTWTDDLSFGDSDAIRIETDKSIYKPGETMKVTVVSTTKTGPVYLDVVDGLSVIDSRFAVLKEGKARIQLPYNEAYKGQLTIAAFTEEESDEVVKASRGVIFPARTGIEVNASFDKATYKPGEDATVKYSVGDSIGRALKSALGVVILDKAVEERARTDADFGGMWSNYSGWLGYGGNFGSVNVKDLNELDLRKPISDDLQLVAELILHSSYYYPNIFHSSSYDKEAKAVFGDAVTRQLEPVATALKESFEQGDHVHPVDKTSLDAILSRRNIVLDRMMDPWGVAYTADFPIVKSQDVVTIASAGPDKKMGTRDDFTAFSRGFEYFTQQGKAIDTAVKNFNDRTGGFIRDEQTLFAELGVRELLDRFGRPYRAVFEGEPRFLKILIRSVGPDGKDEGNDWRGDDFYVWTSRMNVFATIENRITDVQRSLKRVPMNEDEFKESLRSNGVDLDQLRDGFGSPVYVSAETKSRYWDKVELETAQAFGGGKKTERRVVTPVTQKVIEFTIRSRGKDGSKGTYDDATLMQYVHVLAEQKRDDPNMVPVIRPVAFNSNGAIAGVVTDPVGAVIPAASVTATNTQTAVSRKSTTNDAGSYLISNLETGTYTIKVEASAFQNTTISDVPVKAGETTRVDVSLNVGSTNSVVTVSADVAVIDTSSSSVAMTITGQRISVLPKGVNFSSILKLAPGATGTGKQNSTPKVREYFPETLLWQPELITDANGKAELKFKMADNITTWKMYVIASNKDGKIGVAEKEITAFQSFFVDLDPPKFLTVGDEIFLPTQVRNYTDKRQKVDVTMARADWFSALGADKQQIDVDAGNSKNAVFGFKAATSVKAGKQRVTAIAQTDSDAIEKPVTVRPDGQEIVKTESKISSGNTAFEVNFPANALAKTQRAELKIYPNLYSHVAESVEGLLQRPYGCGEQTISSTYPNLMILKFVKPDAVEARKAKQYLQKGYERLIGYQAADGGFTYWGGKDTSDVALTAYALRFLNDAGSQVSVDAEVIKRAESWLASQQRQDGSWTKKYYYETAEDPGRTKLTTTYVARSIAMRKGADKAVLAKSLEYLKARNAEIDEPYALALYGLASLDAGNPAIASGIARQLEKMALTEDGTAYWNLETNTPFYGWGTAGRIETTALVLQLLIRDAAGDQPNASRSDLISKGTLFLLKNKDRYGVWYSTQTTINVLDAFLASLGNRRDSGPQSINLQINGRPLEPIVVASDRIDPVSVDLTDKLNATENRVTLNGTADSPLMSQVVASHYIDWKDADVSARNVNGSRALRLDYRCDKTSPAIMEEVTCSVDAERIGFKGYGMLLVELGTPPGAEVSRESLQAAIDSDWTISRYDVLPDRIVLYMWSKAGGTKFDFKFKPRYGINAQTPSSIVYDYYNPEAQAVVAPIRFVAK